MAKFIAVDRPLYTPMGEIIHVIVDMNTGVEPSGLQLKLYFCT